MMLLMWIKLKSYKTKKEKHKLLKPFPIGETSIDMLYEKVIFKSEV